MSMEIVQKALEEAHAKTEALMKEQREEIAKTGKASEEIQKNLNDISAQVEKMGKQLFELEQKASGGPDDSKEKAESLAAFVAKSACPEEGSFNKSAKVEVSSFARKFLGQDPSNSTGSNLLTPYRLNEIIIPGLRRLTIRQLMAQASLKGTDSLQYVRETGFANNARVVKEGDLKPESTIDFGLKTANAKTIAHIMRASRQIMKNASNLEGYLSDRMEYGLALKEEDYLLNGAGGDAELEGINLVASAYDASLTASVDTYADVVSHAMFQVSLSQYDSTAVILNPYDWHHIALLKDGNGNYMFGGPQAYASNVIWGNPVVATTAQPRGTFTVGAFSMASQIWDNMESTVEFFEQDADNVQRNMITIRCEESLAVAHYRPEAIVKGVFPTATSGKTDK